MTSAVQKVFELQKQFEEARQGAIQELLGQRGQIDEQLKSLGYGEPAAKKAQHPRPADPNKKCPICQQTGHDGRYHRRKDQQGKKEEAKKVEAKK